MCVVYIPFVCIEHKCACTGGPKPVVGSILRCKSSTHFRGKSRHDLQYVSEPFLAAHFLIYKTSASIRPCEILAGRLLLVMLVEGVDRNQLFGGAVSILGQNILPWPQKHAVLAAPKYSKS